LQRAIVFAAPIPVSTINSIEFQFNTAGEYSANQIADMITNGAIYFYRGPETGGGERSFTAINNASQGTQVDRYYLVGNSSVAQGATNASFVVVGTGSILSGNANVNKVSIASGASFSIDPSINVNVLEMRGGTLDQRGISSPCTISGNSGLIYMKNAHLILPLSQSGHVQSYLNMDPSSTGIAQGEISSITFYNPFNAPLAVGLSYPIVQNSPGLAEGQTPTLGSVYVMTDSGKKILITSLKPRAIFDENGNCEIRFSLNPIVPNGHLHKQGGRASIHSHHNLHTTIGSALSVAREERGTSPSGYTGSFTSNPFKVPNMSDFMQMTEGAQAYSSRENLERWSPLRTDKTGFWAQPFGMILREAAQQGQPGFNSRTAGVLFGMDHKLCYDLIIGGAIGYATTKQSLDENSGKTSVRDRFINLFASWFKDTWHLDGALLLGYEHYNQSRNVGNNIFALNHHAGFLMTPHIGGGYNFTTKAGKLSVFANFDYTYCKQFGYQETGANVNDLYVKSSLATMIRSEVGTSISQEYSFSHVNWGPKFSLSLVNKQPIRKGNITTASGSSFEGSKASSTDISPALYSTLTHEDGWSFSAGLVGEFGVRYNMGEAFLKFTKKLGTK
jgi:uncharacterized protein YhjY with autotransporter beta-barrel domain